VSVQDQGSLDSSSLKALQPSLRVDDFVCYVLVVERMKLKTNLVFLIFLVVVYGLVDSHKDMNINKFRIPTTKHFFKVVKCETFKVVNFVIY